jgi:hypothetical protein
MPSRQELRDGKRPEKVQTLNTLDFVGPGTGGLGGITFDATNPNRVMIFSASFGGTGTYVIYEAGQNGLENVGSGAFNSNRASPFHGVALSGEYLAYTSCDEVGDNDIFGFRNLRSCQLIVEKNGQPLSVEPLPLDLFSGSNMPGVAISPSGYIMVAAYNLTGIDGENGNLYLYQIGGGTPGGGTQVGFEKTLLEIPVELPYAGVHYQRKRDAIYVNGNFVMSGECGGGIGAEDTPASASSKPSEGGLWVFNESGNFVAEKNVCDETGLINVGVHHHSIGYAALRGGGSSFIVHTNFIELGQSNSVMHYALSGGVLTQTSKKPTTEEIGGNNTPSFTGPHVVAANDGAVAGKIFTVPGFNEAGTFEDGLNGIRPVVALDEFIVATIDKRISGSLLGTLDNYQVFRVANGTLEFVQELTEVKEDLKALDPRIPPIGLYSFDYSTNPKRIAFWNVTNKGNSAKIFIYEKTSSGLRFVKEMNAPWDTTKIFKSLITRQNIFAIAGDTIAFPTTDGKFEVWENGQKVATEQLPPTKSYHDINNITNGSTDRGERTPHVLVISPQRKLLAMNEFGAYLYTISSVAPPVPPPIFPPPGQGAPPGTLPLNGISGTLDLAKGYLLLLQSLFGKQTITPISNPPIQAGTSTQFQSIFQQAADIINTY